MILAYARTSTDKQDVEQQILAMSDHLSDTKSKTYSDHGTSAVDNKEAFEKLLMHAEKGDVIMITGIDRLDRRVIELLTLYKDLQKRGLGLTVLDSPMFSFNAGDGLTPQQEFMLQIMSGVAQLEKTMIHTRTMRGVRKAQAEGKYKGSKPDQKLANHYNAIAPTWKRTNRELAETLGCSIDYVFARKRKAKRATA